MNKLFCWVTHFHVIQFLRCWAVIHSTPALLFMIFKHDFNFFSRKLIFSFIVTFLFFHFLNLHVSLIKFPFREIIIFPLKHNVMKFLHPNRTEFHGELTWKHGEMKIEFTKSEKICNGTVRLSLYIHSINAESYQKILFENFNKFLSSMVRLRNRYIQSNWGKFKTRADKSSP